MAMTARPLPDLKNAQSRTTDESAEIGRRKDVESANFEMIDHGAHELDRTHMYSSLNSLVDSQVLHPISKIEVYSQVNLTFSAVGVVARRLSETLRSPSERPGDS